MLGVKKFFVVATILLMFTSAKAFAAPLIDADVEIVIEGLQLAGSQYNISLWGKEYYTYKGTRRCELHWGDSKANIIRFALGNNNNVQRALVSLPNGNSYDSFQSGMSGGVIYGAILTMAGVGQNELLNFVKTVFNDAMADPYASYFHKKYNIWASQAQHNIIVDVEINKDRIDYYMYAN